MLLEQVLKLLINRLFESGKYDDLEKKKFNNFSNKSYRFIK